MVNVGEGRLVANKCDLCAGKAEQECVKVCLTNSLKLVTEEGMSEAVGEKRLKAAVALAQDVN
jgi:Fe-S-cluster-containing hydrogenase component 2